MSGFEIPGVVLAIPPLLLAAIDCYEKCLSPFSRFKKFSKEAGQFIKLFNIQKAIFYCNCRILLEDAIDDEQVKSMLNALEHHLWRDPELDSRLNASLDTSHTTRAACTSLIELISERLSEVKLECQRLADAMYRTDKGVSKSGSTSKRRVVTKIRFSLSESRLNQDIADLRDWNGDFGTLASQVAESKSKFHVPSEEPPRDIQRQIQKYENVAKASRQVYKALGQACTKHVEHLAHTCVEVEHLLSEDGSSPQVRFRMALAGSLMQKDPISIVVNATLEEAFAESKFTDISKNGTDHRSLKRQLGKALECAERKAKKSVRFESSISKARLEPAMLTIPNPFSLGGRQNRDFCDHLRKCRNGPIQPHVCVGTLETMEGCKNSVFLATTTKDSQTQQAILLGQLIALSSSRTNSRLFQLHERAHLAKILTIAVLQYGSTPWLRTSWRSNDVVFFSSAAESQFYRGLDLTAPHFNAKVMSQETSFENKVASDLTLETRNTLLYSLGIVLLEIAYWTNWESLRQTSVHHAHYSDLSHARRLMRSGCSEMGGRYDKIVKQLLECDFRCGDDLNSRHLQVAVYRDVVCPLEKLASGFKDLQI